MTTSDPQNYTISLDVTSDTVRFSAKPVVSVTIGNSLGSTSKVQSIRMFQKFNDLYGSPKHKLQRLADVREEMPHTKRMRVQTPSPTPFDGELQRNQTPEVWFTDSSPIFDELDVVALNPTTTVVVKLPEAVSLEQSSVCGTQDSVSEWCNGWDSAVEQSGYVEGDSGSMCMSEHGGRLTNQHACIF